MLLYFTEHTISDATWTLLPHIGNNTPLLLTQNAVYLYAELSARYPSLDVRVLEEDATLRGISLTEKKTWRMADWATKGAEHSPWIKV